MDDQNETEERVVLSHGLDNRDTAELSQNYNQPCCIPNQLANMANELLPEFQAVQQTPQPVHTGPSSLESSYLGRG